MRTSLATAAALALAAVLTLADGAAAAGPVIDDFETGSFSLQAPPGTAAAASVPVSSPTHAVAAVRDVTLLGNGVDPAGADLVAWSAPDDQITMVMPTNGGELHLRYGPATPVDLTDAGQNDRVEATLTTAVSGAVMTLSLTDDAAVKASTSVNVGGPGTYAFPFSDFAGVDLTGIAVVELTLEMPQGDFHLSDVRAMRTAAGAVKFDNTFSPVSGPPYPTVPLTFDVADTEAVELLQISLSDVHYPPGPVSSATSAPILAQGTDSGMGMGSFGTVAEVQFLWDSAVMGWQDSSFDLMFELMPQPGQAVEPYVPALPMDPVSPTGFSLAFEVQYRDMSGVVMATSRRDLAFDAFDGQPIQLQNVMVFPPDSILTAAGTTVGFHVTFDAVAVGTVDVAKTLFQATMTGDCQLAMPTAVRPGVASSLLGLRASPSPFLESTRLAFTLPAAGPARLTVVDVTGRRVARLVDGVRSAGDHTVSWQGRDAGGHPVSPGVYLVTLESAGEVRTEKVVRLR